MQKKEFEKLEEQYIDFFKERPWILRYMNISYTKKYELLEIAVKKKTRIYDLEEFKKIEKES